MASYLCFATGDETRVLRSLSILAVGFAVAVPPPAAAGPAEAAPAPHAGAAAAPPAADTSPSGGTSAIPAAVVPPPASAVTHVDGLFKAMRCRDRFGHDVSLVKVVNLGDIGRAWFMNRAPIIAMDPQVASALPDKLVRFFYDHECAHHVLGHFFYFAADRENDADCWAITHARDAGRLSRDDIAAFAPYLASSPGSPFGHLPGPQRIAQLRFCFDKPSGG